jgi:EAL domain-containing protein (putative c-di-GMP-specific phosphodiesterase class I)
MRSGISVRSQKPDVRRASCGTTGRGSAAAKNVATTAEGVETEEQRQLLRALGCMEMQGFLFRAARPIAEIRQLFSSRLDRAAAQPRENALAR